MPRHLRIHIPGAFHHVTLHGNYRQDIFFSATDYVVLNNLVARATTQYDAHVHAYCWMPNHIHLLIRVRDQPLGRLMHWISSRYSRAVHRRLNTTGHLFQRRYYAKQVAGDQYFLDVIRYIHLNPVRARLAAEPSEYPWSSHHAYSGTRTEPWVITDEMLSRLHADRIAAVDAYREFMNDAPTPHALEFLRELEERGHDDEEEQVPDTCTAIKRSQQQRS